MYLSLNYQHQHCFYNLAKYSMLHVSLRTHWCFKITIASAVLHLLQLPCEPIHLNDSLWTIDSQANKYKSRF